MAKKLAGEWTPTDNPKATVVPGQMRSDREEIPEGFTKEDADKAETMEARTAMARVAAGCQVYWPAPYEVCGAIRDKYNSLGGPNSFLLWPTTNELTNPDGYGKRTVFQNGPIYWSPAGGPHPVVNHFFAAWQRQGWEAGVLGYPTTDEIINPDGIGRRQEFQGAAIYWRLNEAYAIGGAIRDRWNTTGAELGPLGYPTSDEVDTFGLHVPFGERMNSFEAGSIVYSFGLDRTSVGNWFGYDAPGRSASGSMITAQDFNESSSKDAEARVVASCPTGTDHGYRNPYTCVTAYVDRDGRIVPLRWGRGDPNHFGISWFWYEHEFEMHWVERILQSWDDLKTSINPETGEVRDLYVTGITYKYDGVSVSSLEVVTARTPPLNKIDQQPHGVISAYCRGTDQNSSILTKCPQTLPLPFVARELTPGNLDY